MGNKTERLCKVCNLLTESVAAGNVFADSLSGMDLMSPAHQRIRRWLDSNRRTFCRLTVLRRHEKAMQNAGLSSLLSCTSSMKSIGTAADSCPNAGTSVQEVIAHINIHRSDETIIGTLLYQRAKLLRRSILVLELWLTVLFQNIEVGDAIFHFATMFNPLAAPLASVLPT